jgi:hypothetical protein
MEETPMGEVFLKNGKDYLNGNINNKNVLVN